MRHVRSTHPYFKDLLLVDEANLVSASTPSPQSDEDSDAYSTFQNYTPTPQAMEDRYSEMQGALESQTDSTLHEPRLALHDANLQQLKQLSGGQQGSGQAEVSSQDKPPESTNGDTKRLYSNEKHAGSTLEEGACMPAPIIPRHHLAKFARLLQLLEIAAPNALRSSVHGELTLGGTIVPGSSYANVMRGLYTDTPFTLPGMHDAISVLHQAGVPISLLSSRRAKRLYVMYQLRKRRRRPSK